MVMVPHRYEMAANPAENAEQPTQQLRRADLVPRFHVLLTSFELTTKVDSPSYRAGCNQR